MVGAGTKTGAAQAVPDAFGRQLKISAGAMASEFSPQDANQKNYYSDGSELIGAGAYVDVHFRHWIQLEGEGRWLRWNGYGGESQDQYLIGPRVPVKRLGKRGQLYGKALVGYGKMTFPLNFGYGTFTDIAFGGTLEYDLTRKVTLRAADFEYQDWPKWLNNGSLSPYGVSMGVSYRVF